MKRFFVAAASLVTLSCAHTHYTQTKPAMTRAPAETHNLADFETQPNQEVFWGSPEEEEAIFKKMQQEIREVIHRQTAELRKQSPQQRGFHSKTHVCLRANMVLDNNRPEELRYGIFASSAQGFKTWARFSNGVGWKQDDSKPDVRGLSLKVLGIPGKKFMSDERSTQDLIMINSPTGFGKDSRDFMDFAQANSKHEGFAGTLTSGGFAATHPAVFGAVHAGLTSTLAGIESLSKIQFWGGTPYRLGNDQAMKFTVKGESCDKYPNDMKTSSDNDDTKFKTDLYQRASNGFCMGVYVQLQGNDFHENPIEDASKEWNTEFRKVAQLEFFPQTFTDVQKTQTENMCDKMVFNPWHGIAEHQPLGNQNRARKWVYAASKDNRAGKIIPNPFPGWEIK